MAASYSDYDPSFNTSSGANASLAEANVSNVGAAGFVAPGSGNYRLLPTSKLVDAGDPGTAQGTDLDGNPLVADGNGDGIARRDLGAFEVPAAPTGGGPGGTEPVETADSVAPVVGGFSATRTVFTVARASTPVAARASGGTRLRYILSERARVTVAVKRAVKRGGHVRLRTVGSLRRDGAQGANTIRFSGRIGRRALRPGATGPSSGRPTRLATGLTPNGPPAGQAVLSGRVPLRGGGRARPPPSARTVLRRC